MVWLNFSDLIPSLSSKISRLCSFQINHNFLMPHLGLLIDLVVPVEEVQVKDPVLPTMHHQIQQHLAPEHCGTILDNGFTGIKLLVLLDENITILA